jgi:hypothetical protein
MHLFKGNRGEGWVLAPGEMARSTPSATVRAAGGFGLPSVASHSVTLATRPALPLTWAGLSPAGSRQLPGALVSQFEFSGPSRIVIFGA